MLIILASENTVWPCILASDAELEFEQIIIIISYKININVVL